MRIVKLRKHYVVLMLTLLFSQLAGCATPVRVAASDFPVDSPYSDQKLLRLFDRQLLVWKNVPYRLGGITRKGVDCSGFVYNTYKDQINILIPRTTKGLAKIGKHVARNELDIGDLVFFKTGKEKTRHVGIYLGKDEFMHASTSKGVMKSSLNNRYWRRAYWKAKRIID
ncbi:MAG: NlpC/P60 family protein [Gammaproteobacteria bacterium]|nr:NlpC/P60 family protein [Gammaproteobacteria bacterium]